jgi:hypothetical protein
MCRIAELDAVETERSLHIVQSEAEEEFDETGATPSDNNTQPRMQENANLGKALRNNSEDEDKPRANEDLEL